MAKAKKPPAAVPVVRRPKSERKQLDPRFEPLVRGEKMLRKRPPQRARLRDERISGTALIPGVANRNARSVADSRTEALREMLHARAEGDQSLEDALARALSEAVQLEVWRGKSIVGFDVYVEEYLELDFEEAKALAHKGFEAAGLPAQPLRDALVATWVRIEAAFLETDPDASIRAVIVGEKEQLEIRMDGDRAPDAFDRAAFFLAPLRHDRAK